MHHSKAKSRPKEDSASESIPDVPVGKNMNIEFSLPNGHIVFVGTIKTSGLERRPG